MGLIDTGINTAAIVPNEAGPTTFNVSADPTSAIPNASVIKIAANNEQMLVTSTSAGNSLDVGAEATDRSTQGGGSSYTYISTTNPLNISGTLTTLEIWAAESITGLTVGLWRFVSGSTFKCIAVASVGNITQGAKRTVTGLSLVGAAGDFVGVYSTNGREEFDAGSGTDHYWYYAGNAAVADNQSSFSDGGHGIFSVKLLADATPTVTANRAQNGSSAEEHASGADIYFYTPDVGGSVKKFVGMGVL
jgi:hypothetical protein